VAATLSAPAAAQESAPAPAPPPAAAPTTVPASAADEADFDAGLARVAQAMAARKWADARGQLTALLAAHEAHEHVLLRVGEIREDFKRCDFWAARKAPDARQLVGGELQSYDPVTGAIAIRYLKDSRRKAAGGPSTDLLASVTSLLDSVGQGAPPIGDFEVVGGLQVHPISFAGPYALEVRGRMPAASEMVVPVLHPPQIVVCLDLDGLLNVDFGFPPVTVLGRTLSEAPRVMQLRTSALGSTAVAQAPATPLALGAAYACKVRVTHDKVIATCHGRELFNVPRPAGVFGQAGLLAWPHVEEILLSGEANTAWIEGLVDAEKQRAWDAHGKSWDEAAALPAWLRPPPPSGPRGRPLLQECPEADQLSNGAHLQVLQRKWDQHEYRDALTYVGGLDAKATTEAFRSFAASLLQEKLGEYKAALERCERACSLQPGCAAAQVQRARLMGELGQRLQAVEALEQLVAGNPSAAGAWEELARQQLLRSEPALARDAIRRALDARVAPQDLDEVNSVLLRALQGPRWERAEEYASRHYVVRSDLSKQLCAEAAGVLEDSLDLYGKLFGEGPREGAAPEPYRVFLFSGKAGYLAYAEDLLAGRPEGTAGLYHTALKQLLIWNLPNRADMMGTIRHEGFHQYLDRRLDAVPTWFNEGVAEYVETAEPVRGKLVVGQPSLPSVSLLLSPGVEWTPVDRLLRLGQAEFYARAQVNYAEAWAVIHFLLQSGPEERARFDRYLAALQQPQADPDATAALILVEKPSAFQKRVLEHVRGLRSR